MSIVTDVKHLLERLDDESLAARLVSLDPAERREVAAWAESSVRWCRALGQRMHDQAAERRPDDAGWEWWETADANRLPWMEAMVAISVLGPRSAARRIRWRDFFGRAAGARARVERMLCSADPAWAAAFVEEAASAREPSTRLLYDVVVHHGLPCPHGAAFLAEVPWIRIGDKRGPDEFFRASPLMPDVLHRYVAAGHAGAYDDLATLAPALVAEGRVDRQRLLDTCLEVLTRDTRTTSQRTVVKILLALDVTATDLPGLDYLLGVIATRVSPVATALLPLAIDLVTDADRAAELTAVVVARPERKLRRMLHVGLVQDAVVARVGPVGVADALRSLVALDDDADFVATVGRTAGRLAPAASDPPATERPVTGLWHATPVSAGMPRPYLGTGFFHTPVTLAGVLDRDKHAKTEGDAWVADQVLGLIPAEGLGGFTDDLLALAAAGRLHVRRTTGVLEAVFLGGGLSAAWRPALRIAGVVAGRRPPGTADLLRMLAAYAVEVPDGTSALPAEVLAVAAEPNRTKVQAEARHLVDLVGLGEAGGGARPASTGRWWVEADPAPHRTRVRTGPGTAAAVARRLWWPDAGGPGLSAEWAEPSVALADLLATVATSGPAEVASAVGAERDQVAGLPVSEDDWWDAWRRQTQPGPVAVAAMVWARGLLDHGSYARIVSAPSQWEPAARARRLAHEEERNGSEGEDGEWAFEIDELSIAGPHAVIPADLADGSTRLLLHHACECLLLAPRLVMPLATPAYADGTLDLADLVRRLDDQPIVGPLDLLLALRRLRVADADPALLADVDPARRTDSALSTAPLVVRATIERWLAEPGSVGWAEAGTAPVRAGDASYSHPASLLRVDPHAVGPEVLAALGSRPADSADALLALPEPGPQLLRWLVGQLFGDRRHRGPAVLAASRRVTVHRFEPATVSAAVLAGHRAGGVPISAAGDVFGAVFAQGGLRCWWEAGLALLAEAAAAQRRASGFAAFAAVLADVVHEVPEPRIPATLHELAATKGSTRAHIEVRRLVEGARR